MQVIPSPLYPLLQTQVKDPCVLVHTAFPSQGVARHSLTSMVEKEWTCLNRFHHVGIKVPKHKIAC